MTSCNSAVQLQGGLAIAPSLQQQTAMLCVLTDQLSSSETGLASVQWLNLTYCPATQQNTLNVGVTSVGPTAALQQVTATGLYASHGALLMMRGAPDVLCALKEPRPLRWSPFATAVCASTSLWEAVAAAARGLLIGWGRHML